MKRIVFAAVAALAAFAPTVASATTHAGKYSSKVHAELAECVYFQLEGVSVADPAVTPDSPWFALPTNHVNFSTLNAILLSANLARRTITVVTNGTGVCAGPATVVAIVLD